MKIKMLKLAAGPDFTHENGRIYEAPGDLAEAQAQAYVDAGAAEIIDKLSEIETAVAEPSLEPAMEHEVSTAIHPDELANEQQPEPEQEAQPEAEPEPQPQTKKRKTKKGSKGE